MAYLQCGLHGQKQTLIDVVTETVLGEIHVHWDYEDSFALGIVHKKELRNIGETTAQFREEVLMNAIQTLFENFYWRKLLETCDVGRTYRKLRLVNIVNSCAGNY